MRKENFKIFLVILCTVILAIALYAETPVQEGYVDYNGGQTWFRVVGDLNSGAIPLILIHGGPGFPHYYLSVLEDLADERPVILYDQQGCGQSSPLENSDDWRIEFFVEELIALINHLDLDEYHILGQSWGSMVLADYVLFYDPIKLKGVIFANPLMSTAMWVADGRRLIQGLTPESQEAILYGESTGDYSSPEYADAMTEFYGKHVIRLDPWPDSVMQSMMELNNDIYNYMWGPSEFTCTGTLQDYDRTPYLHTIDKPTLFICGEYDEATPETTRYYQRLVPKAKLKVIKDTSHMCFLENPDAFNNIVRKFLKKSDKAIPRYYPSELQSQ